MTQITNKKELLATFAEPIMQGFDHKGNPITYTLFSELDYSRAEAISGEIYENIIEFLSERHKVVDNTIIIDVHMSLPEFARYCLRNVELNGQLEILHATLQIGYMFSKTIERIEKLVDHSPGKGGS